MAEPSEDDFFTLRHARLTRIAAIADLGAWLALIANFIYVGIFVVSVNLSIQSSSPAAAAYDGLGYELSHNPLYAASFGVALLNALLRGGVYFLVLKGVAVGLRMIVDTNLNIKEKQEGEGHE